MAIVRKEVDAWLIAEHHLTTPYQLLQAKKDAAKYGYKLFAQLAGPKMGGTAVMVKTQHKLGRFASTKESQ